MDNHSDSNYSINELDTSSSTEMHSSSNTCSNYSCTDTTDTCTDTANTCTDTTDTCTDTTDTCTDTIDTCTDTIDTCSNTIDTCSNTTDTCTNDTSNSSNTSKTSSSYTNDTCDCSQCHNSSNSYTNGSIGDTPTGSISSYGLCESSCSQCDPVLNNAADVFVYKHGCIICNENRGINEVPLVLGTNKYKKVQGIDEVNGKVALAVEGNIYVSGKIFTGNQKMSQYIYPSNKINMQDKNASHHPSVDTVNQCNTSYYYMNPRAVSNILYVSPINGPVYIILGSKDGNVDYEDNQKITIKDTTLVHNEGASYNIYITVPTNTHCKSGTSIEHYGADCKLKVSSPGTYVLNTSNGAVTFRYMSGDKPCWLIENQFVGNTRILPGRGLTFNNIEPRHVQKLANY